MTDKPISYWMSPEEMLLYYQDAVKEERIKIRSAINRLADIVEHVEFNEGLALKRFKRVDEQI